MTPLASRLTDTLAGIVGWEHVRQEYVDRSGRPGATCAVIRAVPDVVVFPASAAEVAEVLCAAHDHGVAVMPSMVGPAEPAAISVSVGGIVLGLDRLNQILEVNAVERFARIQPGVSMGQLTAATAGSGLRPPFGSDHTTIHRYDEWPVLAMEVVLPTGEIVRTDDDGGHRHRLPEPVSPAGPLAVITEVTLALEYARSAGAEPDGKSAEVGIAYFPTVASACQAMRTVLSGGTMPARLEFVDRARLAAAAAAGLLGVRGEAAAMLVFGDAGIMPEGLRLIGESCARSGALDVTVPANPAWVESVLTASTLADSPILADRGA